jgi:hypothetical protein
LHDALPPHLVFSGIAGHVEEVDFANAGEVCVVGELADHLPFRIQLEELRSGPEMPMSEPVAYDQVPIGQDLEA